MDNYSRYILITGVTSGIGKALAEYLVANENYHVFGIGRDESKLGKLALNANFKFIPFDLNKIDDIEFLFKSEFNCIKFSGFVHCAGIEETLPISLYVPSRIQ